MANLSKPGRSPLLALPESDRRRKKPRAERSVNQVNGEPRGY